MAVKAQAQQTLVDMTDAYSVILTSEAYTFPGTTAAAKAGTCTTQVLAYRGKEQVACSIGTMTCPTGVSAAKDSNATSPTITVTATTSFTTPGEINIPVSITGTEIVINKKFSLAIAFTGSTGSTGATGAPGKGISSTAITYQASSSGTTIPTGTWATSIPAVSASQYLWTRTVITYSDSTSSTSYSVGMMGATGAKGNTGETGADALSIVITSSAGLIFKNTAIATTLTASVYKGGVLLTAAQVTAIGTIKWYKDGSTTAAGTGATLSISAGDVTNSASYVAQLEG